MYPVSEEFHQAVQRGNRQKAMLIFSDAVFTDVDINVDVGIEFHDYFNLEQNLKIGQTPSNEISFSLFNDHRYLNSYEFGDFLATLGVMVGEEEYEISGNAYVRGLHTYVGYTGSPWLTRDGAQVSVPPAFNVSSLMVYDGRVWAFSDQGDYEVYSDATGERITGTNPVNTFMRAKVKNWTGKGFYYNKDSRILFCYDNVSGFRQRYEFCPLGHFIAERPNAPDKIEISMTCYDLMQRFDEDMPDAGTLGITYPTSIGNLFAKLCQYVGLPYRTTVFINSGATIESEPEDFANSTMRTVLGWIAEAAGSNARIDRDGYVVLDWLRTTAQRYDESGYTEFEPYWYDTRTVTKLYNRDTSDSSERILGSGDEAYLIQDNPLLKNAT